MSPAGPVWDRGTACLEQDLNCFVFSPIETSLTDSVAVFGPTQIIARIQYKKTQRAPKW